MGKMIFDDFDDDDVTLPEVTHRNVIAPSRENKKTATADTIVSIGKAAASVTEPVIGLIDHALTLLPNIIGSISTMFVEIEKTAQVKAQVQGQIEVAKQKTRQVEIKELELTKRTALECKKEIELKEIELKKFRDELLSQEKKSKLQHDILMEKLAGTRQIILTICKAEEVILSQIPNIITDEVRLQNILLSLNDCHTKLAQIAHDLLANDRDVI